MKGLFAGNRGITLTEILVALIILSVGALSFIGAFSYIGKAMQSSRNKTVAMNLAQEKVEYFKNISYYRLMVSTSVYEDTRFNPPAVYDDLHYPKETLAIGGVTFERAARIDNALWSGGTVSTSSYSAGDTGLKKITVYVAWQEGARTRTVELNNLVENPSLTRLNASLSGTVINSSGTYLRGAYVRILDRPDWNDSADYSGQYSFGVSSGTYTVLVSSIGYFSAAKEVTVGSGQNLNLDITMIKMASGTVASAGVYISTHIVISQVVASTYTNGQDIEYVELFNPTPNPVNIGVSYSPSVRLNYRGPNGEGHDKDNIDLVYVSTYVPAGHYYLIANAPSFTVGGVTISADAYYKGTNHPPCTLIGTLESCIREGQAGAVQIEDAATGGIIDMVGWSEESGGVAAPDYEASVGNQCYGGQTAYIKQTNGLAQGSQLVRMSGPCSVTEGYGRAYDFNCNSSNFFAAPYPGTASYFSFRPKNSAAAEPVTAATPPCDGNGACDFSAVTDDSLSSAYTGSTAKWITLATSAPATTKNCMYADFAIPNVATGTWNTQIFTPGYAASVANVTVSASGETVQIPSSATSPAWQASGVATAMLHAADGKGLIKGRVYNSAMTPLSNITVKAGAESTLTGAGGYYSLIVSTGSLQVTANPDNLFSYTSESEAAALETGLSVTQNFTLSESGAVRGYITSGTAPLPNITVIARMGGFQTGSSVSDSSGHFYMPNLIVGMHVIQPVLDPASAAIPSTATVSVVSGNTVFVGSFTVANAMGTIKGTVKAGGQPVTTGALILVSTSSISVTPPAIDASNSSGGTVIYAASSIADGTYSVAVRGSSSPYYIRVFYPTVTAGGTTVTSVTASGVTVAPGATVTRNFSW